MFSSISDIAQIAVIYTSGFVVGLLSVTLGLRVALTFRKRRHSAIKGLEMVAVFGTTVSTNLLTASYVLVADKVKHVDLPDVITGLKAMFSNSAFWISAVVAITIALGAAAVARMKARVARRDSISQTSTSG